MGREGEKNVARCSALETEGRFQIEVNFIIQSNKYQKWIKHLESKIEWEDDTWNHQTSVPIKCDFTLFVQEKVLREM